MAEQEAADRAYLTGEADSSEEAAAAATSSHTSVLCRFNLNNRGLLCSQLMWMIASSWRGSTQCPGHLARGHSNKLLAGRKAQKQGPAEPYKPHP